jgi:predicted ribosomally synthesized peptide with SipW-like signal peptide
LKVNKRILRSVLVISVAALAFVAAGSSAFFSDTETSEGNILQAGAIDLRIDNNSYYNGERSTETSWRLTDLTDELFFNFIDLKPGDWGEDTISAHIRNNPAWLCMDVAVTSTPENGQSEPELEVDQTIGENEGELQDNLKFVWWADDGDNVLETDEMEYIIANNVPLSEIGTVTLADSEFNVWSKEPNDPLEGSDENTPVYYIGKAWCFGDLSLEPVEPGENSPLDNPGIKCDGRNAGNESQTDGVYADVSFTAVQSRHNGNYKCVGCEEVADGYGRVARLFSQGLQKDGDPVDPARSDETAAEGAPDGNFVSLGFGGDIRIALDGYVVGTDVTAFEITFGRDNYPEEKADVYVSEDGSSWTLVGTAYNHDTDGKSIIDVSGSGLSEIRFIRLVDTTDPTLHDSGDADGYDLDAVGAVVCLDKVRPTITDQTAIN